MPTTVIQILGYHASSDYTRVAGSGYSTYKQETEFTYKFENFFHPFTGELIRQFNRKSLPGVLDPDFQDGLKTPFFTTSYTPQTSRLVKLKYFDKEIDVSAGGPYANYNWELFFHIPLTIAVHLSKNQRFSEAQRWFHYIFNPTANDTSIDVPQRFWNFIAFRKESAGKQLDELLALLSKPTDECSSEELELKTQILEGYEGLKNNPFQPHRIARTRPLAYMYNVVMKYLDNLIAWGDQLFRQDTLESINEATQIYVLAANVLGKRPEKIPRKGAVRPRTFADLKALNLDALGNALVELEGEFPFNFGIPSEHESSDAAAQLFGMGRTLYFCIPRNDKLLGYWDTVSDRLFKIRHCMNIEGVVRQLALFDPPIDPGMLVKAAAAGINIGSIVQGLNQPVSVVRTPLLMQKALELCAEVRNLGSALLSAIEKSDGEQLALLRQGHEIKIQQLQQEVRFLQWKQAQEATESLLKTRASALERYKHYLRLVGQEPDSNLAAETISLDRRELNEDNFDETYNALVERYEQEIPVQAYPALDLNDDGAPVNERGNLALTTKEEEEISNLSTARDLGLAASIVDATGSAMVFIPDPKIDLHYWGLGTSVDLKVGTAILKGVEITAKILQMTAAWHREQAGIVSRTASHERRVDDWILQSNLAARELQQIGRQIISSLISEQIAYREYQNTQQQIAHSQEVDQFLREKFTNAELYGWMQGELSKLYYEYYRFAFDIARRAEQTMKHELMRPELDEKSFIKFNYWDGGRKGLLSGDTLHLDVKRMEMAYHEHNLREYELTKHVSLQQLSPVALLALKATGVCEISLPEWVFDMDAPGHYMRRIKHASLTIPAITGPYTSVNCTLSLLRSTVRISPLGDVYQRNEDEEDTRFRDYFGTIQSIVTSNAQNDSGMFETNLRDERFLPFEGAGVISTWKLELPKEYRQFDYNSISDVVLHLRYTARQGGAILQQKAVERIGELVGEVSTTGLVHLCSLRHDFPSEWQRFVTGDENFETTINKQRFHYIAQGREVILERITLYALDENELMQSTPAGLDLEALSTDLNDTGEFELSLAPDSVLARERDAQVFVLIRYAMV